MEYNHKIQSFETWAAEKSNVLARRDELLSVSLCSETLADSSGFVSLDASARGLTGSHSDGGQAYFVSPVKTTGIDFGTVVSGTERGTAYARYGYYHEASSAYPLIIDVYISRDNLEAAKRLMDIFDNHYMRKLLQPFHFYYQ